MGAGDARESVAWASASELADYEFCPRAWWYRENPPAEGPSRESRRSAEEGVRFHERTLDGERRRDRNGWVYAAVLAVALLAVVLGVAGALA